MKNEVHSKFGYIAWTGGIKVQPHRNAWTRVYDDLHAVYIRAKCWDNKRYFLMFITCYGFIPISSSTKEKPMCDSDDARLKGAVFGNSNLVKIIARYL